MVDAAIDQFADRVLDFGRRVNVDFSAKVDDVAITRRFALSNPNIQLATPRLSLQLVATLFGAGPAFGDCGVDVRAGAFDDLAFALLVLGYARLPLRRNI